jgi:prepilin-type N-terminal cleavage/methylation domain-containing protein
MKIVRSKAGFTLIELMITVAIVGILAAVAIPAYSDYVIRSKLSEVTHAFDALATAVGEYHATCGSWPPNDAIHKPTDMAQLPTRRATWNYHSGGGSNNWIQYSATIVNIDSRVNTKTLILNIFYSETSGYYKYWDHVNSTLDVRYIPR